MRPGGEKCLREGLQGSKPARLPSGVHYTEGRKVKKQRQRPALWKRLALRAARSRNRPGNAPRVDAVVQARRPPAARATPFMALRGRGLPDGAGVGRRASVRAAPGLNDLELTKNRPGDFTSEC